jgi:hypothetical protein
MLRYRVAFYLPDAKGEMVVAERWIFQARLPRDLI